MKMRAQLNGQAKDKLAAKLDELERNAKRIKCPSCGAKPGQPCFGVGVVHAERAAAGRSKSA